MKKMRHQKNALNKFFKKLNFVQKNLIMIVFVFVLVSFMSIGYSALNETLHITGDIALRSSKDIRITNLSLTGNNTGNGYEKYNSKYTSNTIQVVTSLTDVGDSVSYTATIKNSGTVDMEITDITGTLSNEDIKYNVIGLYEETVIEAGTEKSFTITVSRKSTSSGTGEIEGGLVLELDWLEYTPKYFAYNIEGNSIQDGTPSVSTPVAIESVGDRTVNLFDINGGFTNISVGSLTTIDGNNIIIPYSSGNNLSAEFEQFIPVDGNETYNVSFDLIQGGARILIRMYDETKTIINEDLSIAGFTYHSSYQGIFASTNNINVSFPGRVKYIRFCTIAMNTQANTENIYANFQFSKGGTKKEYEPYGKYKIPITVSGKNMINLTNSQNGKYINSSGTIANSASYNLMVTEKIYVKPSTKYTYSGMGNVQATTVSRTGYQYDENDQPLAPLATSNGQDITFTTSANASYVLLQYVATEETPQFEEGSEATSYVPYVEPIVKNLFLDEPLRKLGNYVDYIDFETKIIYRGISKFIIPNTSKFNGTAEDRVILSGGRSYVLKTSNIGMSPIWQYQSPVKDLNTSFLLSSNGYFYWYPDVTFFDVNPGDDNVTIKTPALQAWLSQQSEEVKTVYYVLESGSSSPIELPEFLKQPGYTTLEINTTIQPSNFNYEFVSK